MVRIKDKKRIAVLFLLHAGIALSLGVGYYVMYRPDAGITRLMRALTGFVFPASMPSGQSLLLRWINGHWADFLWAYALTFILNLVMFLGSQGEGRAFAFSLVADCLMELFQAFGLMRGTFDPWDIVTQIFATLIAQAAIHIILQRRENHDTDQQPE